MLIPDVHREGQAAPPRFGVFLTTLFAFFMLEMGDKTQVATVALAAKYASVVAVIVGTTLGMMIANVPVVYLGEVAARRLPIRLVHVVAALVFLLLGVVVLIGAEMGGA